MERDPTLDFASDQFDALKALYTKDLKPPCDDIQPYDNLASYWAAVQRQTNRKTDRASASNQPPKTAAAAAKSARKGIKINDIATKSARTVNKEKKLKNKAKPNVLERMKPLNERKSVHIWTRSYDKLRGICRGFVAAFDKHMNVVLVDVDEVYTLPHYFMRSAGGKNSSKVLAETASHDSTAAAVLHLLANDPSSENYSNLKGIHACSLKSALQYKVTGTDQFRRIKNFDITEDVIKTDQSFIIVRRYLHQVYLRGENIVMASLANVD
ncbi:uncharacterized protein TRIADDRAFT_52963 [Trichoplax adhaerens]|uniref:LSM domain-containing protein n=1 Tax=Trichoplax adhaerens TaxID=10228 RepID=B3RMX7_TRIAD|nr:hypothetical protein TRIADDRAFT_52963 [Trichoplax adhaerens]EDV27927.1 hypothetical protein TRIADDRAFT_52963 [Trichoplax adhaerens]|eukprot:XP_002109761.1 hypothetical protein TRIADDRAFT_52963 [Trichoplax adhaerens]